MSVTQGGGGGRGFADKLLAVPVRLYTKDITLLKRSGKIWKGAGAKSYLTTGFLKNDLKVLSSEMDPVEIRLNR